MTPHLQHRECSCGATILQPGRTHCAACETAIAQRQYALTAHCPRCGEALHDDVEIAQIAGAAADLLDQRRLTVPAGVKIALRLIEREMACRLGRCLPRAG